VEVMSAEEPNYCKCAFTDPDGTFNPGEACPVHPDVVPQREPDTDEYGNPMDGSSQPYCCFPNCGCDGARLCMAENGPSGGAMALNLERKAVKP
jgi:hypothetical protein